jgi:hypothetical protein
MELKILLVGILAGMVGGALIVANNSKARQTVKDTQEKVIEKTEELAEKCKRNCKKHSSNVEEE